MLFGLKNFVILNGHLFQTSGTQLKYKDTEVQVRRLDWKKDTWDSEVNVVLAAGEVKVFFELKFVPFRNYTQVMPTFVVLQFVIGGRDGG